MTEEMSEFEKQISIDIAAFEERRTMACAQLLSYGLLPELVPGGIFISMDDIEQLLNATSAPLNVVQEVWAYLRASQRALDPQDIEEDVAEIAGMLHLNPDWVRRAINAALAYVSHEHQQVWQALATLGEEDSDGAQPGS